MIEIFCFLYLWNIISLTLKIKAIFLFIIFQNFFSFGQEMLPYIENFSKSNYKGDNQVWNLCQAKDNAMYFANNHFFLRYNGVKWEKYTLPNKTIIRSVFADNDLIFTGSYTEFGYWKREKTTMVYHSLSSGKSLFDGNSNNEEIWKIFKFENSIYFQSFNEIYLYDYKSIKKIRFPFQISYSFPVDNKLYFASVTNGIFEYKNGNFIKNKNLNKLENTVVHNIEKNDNATYFFTKGKGIFIEKDAVLKVWQNELNQKLKSELIISARFIDQNIMAIGTAFNGLYLVDLKNGTVKNINKSNGLQNNSVLSISFDSEKDLWLGLDNGITHIELNSPYNLFSDPTGKLGSVYAINATDFGFYLGSNHGLFSLSKNKLNFISGTEGQVWDINSVKDKFIIGHNDGTFFGNNSDFKKTNLVSGGWKFLKSKYDSVCFQANYSGIVIYENNDFTKFKIVKNLAKPIKNIIQTSKYELWATDNYKGLYKIIFKPDYEIYSVENVSKTNLLQNDYNVKMIEFQNQLLFYINEFWYQYNNTSKKLEKNKIFNNNFKNIIDVVSIDSNSFLVLKNNLLYLISNKNDIFVWDLIPEKYYFGKIVNQDTKVFSFNKNLFINLDDGFINIKPNFKNIEKIPIKIEAFYKNISVDNNTKIEYNQTVTIEIISPFYGNKNPDLYYSFNSKENFKTIKNNKIILNNLSSGTQIINVFQNYNNKKIQISKYQFFVQQPWYFSYFMIITYILLSSLFLFLYYRWNKIRYLEKLKIKEEELRHQNEINKLAFEAINKEKIQQYEKHILELQVQAKASEVAEKSLSIAKQTDMIDSIQKTLAAVDEIDVLKNKIQKTIKQNVINKREWQSFESNLFKSNEDFLHRLAILFPQLTSRDKKLCIYLKMNLTSKETAPLMNISYRSIELHRYRLRKKIGIETDINLSSYMNSI